MVARPRPVLVERRRGRQLEQMMLLQRAAQQINSILDPDVLLDRIVNDVAHVFGCEAASVWLHDRDGGGLLLAASTGTQRAKGCQLAAGEQGIVGHVAASGRPYYASDVSQDLFYIPCDPGVGSEVAIPLKVRDRVIGVFSATHTALDAFSRHQREILEILADHIAVAVENARTVERERCEQRRLHREAEEARLIQQALFPRSCPFVPGYAFEAVSVPAGFVGGDWYDFIPLNGGLWGVVLADVSGKGMAAALLMSATRSIVRALAEYYLRAGEILTRLNRAMMDQLPPERLVTMVFGILDPASRGFCFANAGHPWPLLLDADGPSFLETDAGLPLGIAEGFYAERRVQLAPGSRLLLYSDGISEAMNADGEEYGRQRLQEHFHGRHGTAESLLQEVRSFADGRSFQDDATVVLLRATESTEQIRLPV